MITTDLLVRLDIMQEINSNDTIFLRAPAVTYLDGTYTPEVAEELLQYGMNFCSINLKPGKKVIVSVMFGGHTLSRREITVN